MSKEKQDLDTVKVMEEHEGKRKKGNNGFTQRPDQKPLGRKPIEKDPVAHNPMSGVPEAHRKKKITTKDSITARTIQIEAGDISAVSRYYYVNDIHTANPQVLHEAYWAIMPGHSHVCAPLPKEDFLWMIKNTKVEQIICVVDCSYTPALSYGWKRSEIKGDFPTLDEIAEYDKRLKDNQTHFRNWPVKVVVKQAQEEITNDEEDDFELSLDEDDDDDMLILEDDDEEGDVT